MLLRSLVCFFSFAVSPAFATPVHFDFSAAGSPSVLPSIAYTQSGLTLTATGTALDGSTLLDYAIHVDADGLGVYGGTGDGVETDGLGPDETLHLAFSAPVTLLGAAFAQIGSNDEYRLQVAGYADVSAAIPGGNAADSAVSPVDFSVLGLFGDLFQFTVPASFSDYKLLGLSVDYVAPTTTTVDEPAAIVLMLVGLLPLLFRRRKGMSTR